MAAAGKDPYLPALDSLVPRVDALARQPLGLMDIPVAMIVGTKSEYRQRSFASNFLPIMEENTEFAFKWSELYDAQIHEGIREPIKVYEYLHRFYVQEGNKRVSVCRMLDMPSMRADVTRLMPTADVLAENPVYAEFLKFYNVSRIYCLECTQENGYSEIAELVGMDLKQKWPKEISQELRSAYLRFSVVYKSLEGRMPDLPAGDAFLIYLRVFIGDALKDQPRSLVEQRVISLRNEFLTVLNSDNVGLVKSSGEARGTDSLFKKAGDIVSRVIPTRSYTEKDPFKAAFIYDELISDSRWTTSHEQGRLRLEEAFGGVVKTRCYENCGDHEAFEAAVQDAADWGAKAVFTTRSSMIDDTLRAAIKYNQIEFLNCSVNQAFQAVRTYFLRMYEPKLLEGMIAGIAASCDGTHRIGYCSKYPIYGTIADINAFAIGAAMTDPLAKIYLEWESQRNTDWWGNMIRQGIHVISSTDSIHSAGGKMTFGLCYAQPCEPGEGDDPTGTCRVTNICSPIYKWGRLYQAIIKAMLDGRYYTDAVHKKDQATNYWWGMDSGVVGIALTDKTPYYTGQLIDALRRDITAGIIDTFRQELRSQDGIVRREDDPLLSDWDIITMDWLNENIIGEIPSIDSLNDKAQSTVKYSGVAKTRRETSS